MEHWGQITTFTPENDTFEASFPGLLFKPELSAARFQPNELMETVDNISEKITFNALVVHCTRDDCRQNPEAFLESPWEFIMVSEHPWGNEAPPDDPHAAS